MNRSELVELHLAARRTAEVTKKMLEQDAAAEYDEQGTAGSWRGRDFTVSTAIKQGGPVIADDAAVLDYVRRAYPTEVETLQRVRPAFMKVLLDRAAKLAAPCDTDGTIIPGLDWQDGGEFSHVSIRPSDAMRQRLEELATAIANGHVPFALPQTEAVDA